MFRGYTNRFLVTIGHSIAIQHNDESVLERYHVSKAFAVAHSMHGRAPYAHLSTQDYLDFRRLVIDMVLATDVSKHMEFMARLHTTNFGGDEPSAEQLEAANRMGLQGALMMSDIGMESCVCVCVCAH